MALNSNKMGLTSYIMAMSGYIYAPVKPVKLFSKLGKSTEDKENMMEAEKKRRLRLERNRRNTHGK